MGIHSVQVRPTAQKRELLALAGAETARLAQIGLRGKPTSPVAVIIVIFPLFPQRQVSRRPPSAAALNGAAGGLNLCAALLKPPATAGNPARAAAQAPLVDA